MLAVALTAICSGTLHAELTAEQIWRDFNANGGWAYSSTGTVQERLFTTRSGNTPDLRAYSPTLGTAAGIYTMCVGSGSSAPATGTATLRYDPNTGYTQNTSGQYLSVGGAVLYQRYAAGTLSDFNYSERYGLSTGTRSSDASALRSAIMDLNWLTATSALTYNWTGNKYLQYLLMDISGFSLAEINDVNNAAVQTAKIYWAENYNTNLYYSDLGNYAVFMMDTGSGYQTQLYVRYASHTGSYDNNGVPEPATLLLWTIGTVGTFGIGHYRKRSRKV